MAHSHALSSLIEIRNQYAGKLADLQQQSKQISLEIDTLDAAIKIIDPDFKLTTLKSKRKHTKNAFFKHGECSRFTLDCLRDFPVLSTTEIADKAISHKGMNRASTDTKALQACILTVLSRQRKSGLVVEMGRASDGTIKWKLAN